MFPILFLRLAFNSLGVPVESLLPSLSGVSEPLRFDLLLLLSLSANFTDLGETDFSVIKEFWVSEFLRPARDAWEARCSE